MGLTLDYLPVNSAVRGPALDPAESAWEGWTANRNLLHPASRYQLSFAEVGAHTVTAYGEIPTNDSVKSLLISWEATKDRKSVV